MTRLTLQPSHRNDGDPEEFSARLLPDGRLWLSHRFGSRIYLNLIDERTGSVIVHTAHTIGLDPLSQARFQALLDEQRNEFAQDILTSKQKRKDGHGNLLVCLPELREAGHRAVVRLQDSIQTLCGPSISIHFRGLTGWQTDLESNEDGGELLEPELTPMLKSLYRDWFLFGFPATYIVRGGAHDPRRGEIPEGQVWIQSTEDCRSLEEGYDNTFDICRYEELPRRLRQLFSEDDIKPYLGKLPDPPPDSQPPARSPDPEPQ